MVLKTPRNDRPLPASAAQLLSLDMSSYRCILGRSCWCGCSRVAQKWLSGNYHWKVYIFFKKTNHIYRPLQRLELSELKVKDCFCWRNKTYERLSKGLSFSSGGCWTLPLFFCPYFLSSLLFRQQTSVRHCSSTIILFRWLYRKFLSNLTKRKISLVPLFSHILILVCL